MYRWYILQLMASYHQYIELMDILCVNSYVYACLFCNRKEKLSCRSELNQNCGVISFLLLMSPTNLSHPHTQHLGRLAAKTVVTKDFLLLKCSKRLLGQMMSYTVHLRNYRNIFSMCLIFPPNECL